MNTTDLKTFLAQIPIVYEKPKGEPCAETDDLSDADSDESAGDVAG